MYEWRIRETGRGDYMAEYGAYHEGGARVGCNMAGTTMPTFITVREARFDTLREAKAYIKRNRT